MKKKICKIRKFKNNGKVSYGVMVSGKWFRRKFGTEGYVEVIIRFPKDTQV